MGSNPARAWIFLRSYFYCYLSSIHNCEDHFRNLFFNRSSHTGIYDFHLFSVIKGAFSVSDDFLNQYWSVEIFAHRQA